MPHRWLAFSLQGAADNITSTAVALLSLIGLVALGYGLTRAVIINRRSQIVVADLDAPDGCAELADAVMLSQVARRYVQRQVTDQRTQIARIERTILAPATMGVAVRLDEAALEQMKRAGNDSITMLLSTLQAVAPAPIDRFLSLFSLILPPPRGISVSAVMIRRGTDAAPRLGASVAVSALDGRLHSSAVFWETAPALADVVEAQPGGAERILALLEPATRWIAVHLVLSLLIAPRRRVPPRARQGLQHLLVGGLFLQAMRDYPAHALTFGEEAIAELERAGLLLPRMPLPITTLAGVHERMGWSHQKTGNPVQALDNFRAAVRLWHEAQRVATEVAAIDAAGLAVLVDRRLKAQLASGDLALCRAALVELQSIPAPATQPYSRSQRYNRACLYAQAYKADPQDEFQELALRWLGLALVAEQESSLWNYAAQHDPELIPIHEALQPFLVHLRSLIPSDPARLSETDLVKLITAAIDGRAS